MKKFLAVAFAAALGATLTASATADTVGQKVKSGYEKTKDAAERTGEKISDKTKDVKDRMLGRKAEGPEDHRGTKHQRVTTLQQSLKDKGHDPGSIDGRMGPRTRAAVASYQKAEGLRETGHLNDETRTKLGM